METKMITIPFDLERAKMIQEGEEKGKIITRSGRNARIVCWDLKDRSFSLVVLVYNKRTEEEICIKYQINGNYLSDSRKSDNDLVLQVPEYTQYKDGDILVEKDDICPFIYKSNDGEFSHYYAGININNILTFSTNEKNKWCSIESIARYADEEEKQQLINALQDSKEPIAKEYLKRFFNIEKEEFKPFDKVLVKDGNSSWKCSMFSHINNSKLPYPYVTISGGCYEQCIHYNKETKHLLGTNKNWENKQ